MLKILNTQQLMFLGRTVAVAMVLANQDRVEARPKYLKSFATKDSGVAAQAKKVKCGVCHVGKKKKNRNDYGKALAKALKKRGAIIPKAIDAALTETEAAKNARGVTFGSLIKAGKLPGTK